MKNIKILRLEIIFLNKKNYKNLSFSDYFDMKILKINFKK
jgi:hypothetical protein